MLRLPVKLRWKIRVLREVVRCIIGDGFFAECPSFCRVFFIGRSAKRLFVECHRENTRQTNGTRQRGGLASAEHSANNNTRQRGGLLSVGHSANQNTRQRADAVNPLPSVFSWHSVKRRFAECHFLTLDKPYFFHFWPPNFFCSPHTIPGTPCSNVAHFSDFFYIF